MSTKEALAGMRTLLGRARAVSGRTQNRRLLVRVEQRATAAIMHVEGRLTFEEAQAVHQGLDQAWRVRPSRLVVNLENCSFADSAGVAMLVSAMRLAWTEGVGFILVGLQPQLRAVLEMNRLDTKFEIRPTLEDALEK